VDQLGLSLAIPLRWRETVGPPAPGRRSPGTQFTAEDVSLLSALAGQMSVSLQNAILVKGRVEWRESRRRCAWPGRSSARSGFTSSGDKPLRGARGEHSLRKWGDLYDLCAIGRRGFVLAVADVAGHGVPAALLSSMLQCSLRTRAASVPSVAEILRSINSLVYRERQV
jgi:hypothetical protein